MPKKFSIAGARSGLFFEQIRVIKEMRDADVKRGRTNDAVRPIYMLWENVAGALSSGTEHGEDFRVVLAGLVYVASSQVMLGMFPANELAESSAPFAMSTGKMIGTWFKPVVSLVTMITCFTSLSSWMMLVSESAMESAESGDFPKFYKEVNKKGVPMKGLLFTSALMSVMLLFFGLLGSGGRGMGDIFKDVINIAVLLTMIPYIYSSMNLLRFDKQKGKGAFILIVSLIATAFCLVAIIGGDSVSIAGTFIVSLVVLIFYARKEGIQASA